MSQAKQGDTVKIHYTGRLSDGMIFDSSDGREPLEFTLGSGQVIPGFDKGVAGMGVGEKKTIEISMAEAYGAPREEMIAVIERSQFPEDMEIEVGQQLQLGDSPENSILVTITGINSKEVTLDGNHPLAGKDLIFDLELVAIG